MLSRNPISEAIEAIATAVGREVVVVAEDEEGRGVAGVAALELRAGDAVVLCDDDAPDAPRVLRDALASPASYVAMMASRRRAEGLARRPRRGGRAPASTGCTCPAGLDTGGKAPGEIAASVVAEIVAEGQRALRRAAAPRLGRPGCGWRRATPRRRDRARRARRRRGTGPGRRRSAAAKTTPETDSASAAPSESAMDSAEELKPRSASVETASIATPVRG